VNGNPSLQFRQSRWKHLGLIVLFFVMAGVSYFRATRADDPVVRGVGWVGAVFFALGILASGRGLIVGGAPIVMDETGFTDERLKVGTIPWNQVAECYVAWLKGTSFLCFQLKQPELYFHPLSKAAQRVRKLNQAWGFGDLSFSFVGLSPSLEEAVEFVRARGIEVVERRVIP
jgi:hypothetical protein